MSKPHLLVGGLGRCGTTLMMHMLKAGGVPCVGEPPAFEIDELNHRAVSRTFLDAHQGHALKLLDPHLVPLPLNYSVKIWLDRDVKEQTKSQIKMAMTLAGLPSVSRTHMRRWQSSLRADRKKAIMAMPAGPMIELSFECLIARPADVALQLSSFLCPWWPCLDVDAMAARVLPRTSDCTPDLSIETALLEEAERTVA